MLKKKIKISAGQGVERKVLLHCWWDITWYRHYGEQYGGSFKKLKIEPPYDPGIPLPGIYPEKNMI